MSIKPSMLIATRNISKVRELGSLLHELPVAFVSLLHFPNIPDPEETGASFEENAVCKAEYAHARTGMACIADDSGLMVDALGGAPGIHSHRFLGDEASDAERNFEILRRLEGISPKKRTARFVCALAIVSADGVTTTVSGICEGRIAPEPRGDNGFGYDPIFFLPKLGRTMAELSPEEKNSVSHRGHAARAAAPVLWRLLREGRLTTDIRNGGA